MSSASMPGRFSLHGQPTAQAAPIEFQVRLEAEDFRRMWWGNSLRFRPFASLYFYTGLAMVLAGIFYFSWDLGGWYPWLMMLLFGGVDVAAIHAYYGFMARRNARHFARSGKSLIQVSATGIVDRDDTGLRSLSWSAVNKIDDLKEAIYVHVLPLVMIFPLRSFRSQQEKHEVAARMRAWSASVPKPI